MIPLLVAFFLLTYLAITLEHPLRVNKSASALLGAGVLWIVYALTASDTTAVAEELSATLSSTAEIAFFLMGAMAIVEVIDSHAGFDVITARIRTQSLVALMWLVCGVTFLLSAVLDNLTTTIVMVSLLRKLLAKHEDRLLFSGMIVIAANAGGAWSPIGDVTTTMLWIGGQITAITIMKSLLVPSLINLALPLGFVSWSLRHAAVHSPEVAHATGHSTTEMERNLMFFLGIGVLIAVPAFKAITHLPPFLGVLLGLGLIWLVGDLLHKNKSQEARDQLNLTQALSRIDLSSIIFFVGILLAVATLEHSHILTAAATWLDATVGRQDYIVLLIGMLSAVVDNVPLVASSIGMYSLEQHPTDSFMWEFLAYCAGTGGSILIIGSAAGIAAMGIEKIKFSWYLRKMTPLALVGYFAGAIFYILERSA